MLAIDLEQRLKRKDRDEGAESDPEGIKVGRKGNKSIQGRCLWLSKKSKGGRREKHQMYIGTWVEDSGGLNNEGGRGGGIRGRGASSYTRRE